MKFTNSKFIYTKEAIVYTMASFFYSFIFLASLNRKSILR